MIWSIENWKTLSCLYVCIITPAWMRCREMMRLMDSGTCARKLEKPWPTQKGACGQTHFSRGGPTVIKFHFTNAKLRDKHFSTNKLKAKYQISKSRGRLVTLFRLLMFCRIVAKLWSLVFAGWSHQAFFHLKHDQLACRTCCRYLAREIVLRLSVATHGFIACYGDVHRTGMESLCWRGETGGMPPDTLTLALPLRASLFHITHNFYHYDLMTPSKISAHATGWGPAKMLPIGPRTC